MQRGWGHTVSGCRSTDGMYAEVGVLVDNL